MVALSVFYAETHTTHYRSEIQVSRGFIASIGYDPDDPEQLRAFLAEHPETWNKPEDRVPDIAMQDSSERYLTDFTVNY